MKYAALLILAAVGIVAAQSTPEKRVTKEQPSLAAQESRATNEEHNTPGVTVIVKQENSHPDNPTKDQDDENIRIQRKVANFTAWLVGVGLLQAIILGFTIRAINKQTRINQNIERAWVMAELRCSPGTSLLTGTSIYQGVETSTTSAMAVELHCVNDGNSPAWVTEKSARLVVVPQGGLPKFPQLSAEDVLGDELQPLGPGRGSVVTWDATGKGRHGIETATLIYGVVKYTDIFKEKRETWFCYQLTGYKTNRKLVRIPGNPEYNRNT